MARASSSLYTGLDLSGWKADDEAKKHWQPQDRVLHYDGKGEALRTEKEFGDASSSSTSASRRRRGRRAVFGRGDGKSELAVTVDAGRKFVVVADAAGFEGGKARI